jgi:FkbM family methyltransferase
VGATSAGEDSDLEEERCRERNTVARQDWYGKSRNPACWAIGTGPAPPLIPAAPAAGDLQEHWMLSVDLGARTGSAVTFAFWKWNRSIGDHPGVEKGCAMARSDASIALDSWADRVKRNRWLSPPARWGVNRSRDARRRYRDLRFAARTRRLTPDWRAVCRARAADSTADLPSVRLRNEMILEHGGLDNPVGLLEEVWLDRLYDFGGPPPSDATMVDIGANIGAVSMFWASRAPSLRIHAYEPNPSARATLLRNRAANSLQGRVDVFSEAVGGAVGSLDLWVGVPTDLSTGYSDQSPVIGEGSRVSVPMVGMSQVWDRLQERDIWLLKIDTEGAEGDILEGAPAAMLRACRHLILEWHDNICPGVSARCRAVLAHAGFTVKHEHSHPWDEGIIYAGRP